MSIANVPDFKFAMMGLRNREPLMKYYTGLVLVFLCLNLMNVQAVKASCADRLVTVPVPAGQIFHTFTGAEKGCVEQKTGNQYLIYGKAYCGALLFVDRRALKKVMEPLAALRLVYVAPYRAARAGMVRPHYLSAQKAIVLPEVITGSSSHFYFRYIIAHECGHYKHIKAGQFCQWRQDCEMLATCLGLQDLRKLGFIKDGRRFIELVAGTFGGRFYATCLFGTEPLESAKALDQAMKAINRDAP